MGVLSKANDLIQTLDDMSSQRVEEALELGPSTCPQEVIDRLIAESEFLDDVAALLSDLVIEVRSLAALIAERDAN